MRFPVDAQLPPMLADWLRTAGYHASHVQEVGLLSADDAAIRAYACLHRLVVITKDRDFQPTGAPAVQVIWVRTGNIGTRALIARFESTFSDVVKHLVQGSSLVELR